MQQGQRVRAGDRLLSFDIDLLARRAKSLLTPVIVLEGSGYTVARRSESREVAVGDLLMELVPVTGSAAEEILRSARGATWGGGGRRGRRRAGCRRGGRSERRAPPR